ncbi:uncharacterized protein A4U43_C07F6580 [Asparagus officinalis]|uniref:Potassium transporter n=1 Tax=Asparagus officinalis TaxID=4686 RepID=A0A5P1EA08_ASPOF|nr:uncharacterized protein A4U43_C07F6580 [Asparagus officinalis]
MDPEIGNLSFRKKESWKSILLLAYQSLGVVYGDLSISPLYVYKSTFAEDITHSETNEEIFGVLSFVFWTLTLVPLFKYVFIVLRADDNGEGGTFALYSLICRHANVSLLPNRQVADEELSTYVLENAREAKNKSRTQNWLEKHKNLHVVLLIVVMLGTCMVIGDGVLTPAISVFSAVSGLEFSVSKDHREYAVVPITCFVLLCLFALQHFGTHRVGFLFAPIILTWLLCISALGIYNIIHWNPHVYQALSPYYMFKFLKKTRKGGWMSLGGILLCITGSEAMFADLGHFSYTAIQIAFTLLVYPALILAYMGQAAYLSQHHNTSYQISFYVSVPAPNLGIVRVPGVGLVYSDLVSGIPSNFFRFVTTLPAFHRILVFLCVKSVPVPFVPPAERYLVGRVGPPSHRSYRCIVRYGYRDVHQDIDSFESELVSRLSDFIKLESAYQCASNPKEDGLAVIGSNDESIGPINGKKVRFLVEENDSFEVAKGVRDELEDLMEAREAGIAFILGHSHVKAKAGSSMLKKVAIDFVYNFLRRNCRGPDVALRVPPASLLEVGMVYVL